LFELVAAAEGLPPDEVARWRRLGAGASPDAAADEAPIARRRRRRRRRGGRRRRRTRATGELSAVNETSSAEPGSDPSAE